MTKTRKTQANHERPSAKSREETVTSHEALVDEWWGRLEPVDGSDSWRKIDRDRLRGAMLDAAVAAAVGDLEPGGGVATGPGGPLNDVTRFLINPGCRVRHASLDLDLQPVAVDGQPGAIQVQCTSDEGGLWVFPLDKLVPAGVADDMMREAVRVMARAMTEDMVAQLIEAGALKKPDPDHLPAFPVDEMPLEGL